MKHTKAGILHYVLIFMIGCTGSLCASGTLSDSFSSPSDIILPEGTAPMPEAMPHLPDRLHAFVWRNWNLIELDKLAAVLKTTPDNVEKIARSMGLAAYKQPTWSTEQIYITLIRRNWHLLPYEQILQLVGMTPEQLNHVLREDDFLWIKLGMLKPACDPLYYRTPDTETLKKAEKIRLELENGIGKKGLGKTVAGKDEEPRFAFIQKLNSRGDEALRSSHIGTSSLSAKTELTEAASAEITAQEVSSATAVSAGSSSKANEKPETLRFIYSYFALFGDPLSDDDAVLFSDGLLEKLSALGVNGVWLHVLLRDMAPGGVHFPEFGAGSEKRLKNLSKAVTHAKRYGIDIYLYMNEPRAMHKSFFDSPHVAGREQARGVQEGDYYALCTSNPHVRDWMKDALSHVFTQVPGLGGVFTITGSENLTYCNSHGRWQQCPRCKEKTGAEVVADVNALIAEGVHRAAPDANVIAWDWGWNGHGYAADIIEKLPDDVWLMSVSEWALPIERGGVTSTVGEYSISSVGPGPRAKAHWEAAKKQGLKAAAKVQFNCTWEIAAVPYVPVMDLIAEHCSNLTECGVDGYLLSWTLGGYPSPNLEIPQKFDRYPRPSKEDVLQELAVERYGKEGAKYARKAWTLMSNAYREYPYSGGTVYNAPVQVGPANLFRPVPTGYKATMVGIPYDDLDKWRTIYPPEVFAGQFEKIAAGFAEGIPLLEKALSFVEIERKPAIEAELRYAKVVRIHFASVANQTHFILFRDEYIQSDTSKERKSVLAEKIRRIVKEEMVLTRELYTLTLEDACIGFESTNHYFYVPNDLLEKLINCRYVLELLNL